MNSLVAVLTRFRENPIAITADVNGMFHKVKMEPKNRSALKFLWWPKGNLESKPIECKMTVHLFGATSSPSCASYALKYTAEKFKAEYSTKAVETMAKNK